MGIATTPARSALLSVRSADEVRAREEAAKNLVPSPVILQLASYIDKRYQEARNERQSSGVDDKLIEAVRLRKGVYAPDKLESIKAAGQSDIFLLLTEEKCAGAESWIGDVLLPSDGKPWGLTPTPIPDLPEEMIQRVIAETMAAVQQDIASGYGQPDPRVIAEFAFNRREEYLARIRDFAKQAAERMETKIDDQLVESKFMDVFDDFLKDVVTFGTGIIEGPLLRKYVAKRWGAGGQLYISTQLRLEFDRVSPFDFFPSPGAMSPQDGYCCHRLRNSRRQIENLKGLAGVNDAAVDKVLTEYGRTGLQSQQYTDYERARLGDQTLNYRKEEIIEGVKFKGCVQGSMLIEWGVKGLDPLREYEIQAIKFGDTVVRTMLNPDPLYRRNYFKAVYEPVIDSFWGRGVPHLMKDIQDTCNAAARSLVWNMGLCAGPQVFIDDVNRIPRDQDVTTMYPGKIWQFQNTNVGIRTNDPIQFKQIESRAQEFLEIIEKFSSKADTRTRIPAYAYGSDQIAGAGQTASGLSMLMNNASRSIKRILAGFDRDLIKPIIEAMYDWNMLYDPDPMIKGDVNIVARGAMSIMVRETKLVKIQEFLRDTVSPTDTLIVDVERRRNLIAEQAKELGMPIDEVVVPKEELRKRIVAVATAPPALPPGGDGEKGKPA